MVLSRSKITKLLNLDKPLVIFDVETTGLSLSTDRIIELAYMKIYPNGKMLSEDIFLNPEMEISREAGEIHGIRNEDLIGKPTFREKAQELWQLFCGCYYGGFNILNFDLPILRREFIREGIDFNYSTEQVIDSRLIMQYMEPRTLSFAYKHYCKKERKDSHNAMSDVIASAEILEKQANKYQHIRDIGFVNSIHRLKEGRMVLMENTKKFYWKNGEAYFAFSKYRGKPIAEVAKEDPDFLSWLVQADFSDDLKNIVSKALAEKEKVRKRKPRKVIGH